MKARLPWFVCLLTAAGLILTSAQQVKYLQLGGRLELDITDVAEPITGVLWKHGPNKVAEWDQGFGPDVDYYGTYKKRTELVRATGKLVVNSMTIEDIGIYSVEVNGRVQSKTYTVEVINDVPKPNVEVKPLACGPVATSCTLVCGGDVTKSGPVTYRWKKDEGEWMASSDSSQTTIFNDEEGKKAKQFMCEIKNEFSVEQSDLKDNPFYSKESIVGAVVGGIFGFLGVVIVILGGSLLGVKYSGRMREMVASERLNKLLGVPASADTNAAYSAVTDTPGGENGGPPADANKENKEDRGEEDSEEEDRGEEDGEEEEVGEEENREEVYHSNPANTDILSPTRTPPAVENSALLGSASTNTTTPPENSSGTPVRGSLHKQAVSPHQSGDPDISERKETLQSRDDLNFF